ncbi:hypothetical protein ACFSJ3_01415 [Corallincola platygyrae]|uniref:3-hydroxylacyl-ACP dehydratase n=1 Tax=Corallincola platygyrae TaxID=1193278 RepID=A0ABW4XIM0_9GAMM
MDPFRYPIEVLLPHDHPMILIDGLVGITDSSATAKVTLTEDCLLLDGTGKVSSSIAIEWMAQTIAAHAGYKACEEGRPVQLGFLLGTRRFRSTRGTFNALEQFTVDVEQLYLEDGMAAFSCAVTQNGEPVVNATVNTYQPNEEQLKEVIGDKSE